VTDGQTYGITMAIKHCIALAKLDHSEKDTKKWQSNAFNSSKSIPCQPAST